MPSSQSELLANAMVGYLFDQYRGARHVRRVASWIGFLICAFAKIRGGELKRNRSRQLIFEFKEQRWRLRYNHSLKPRGGIEIVEIQHSRGEPDGSVVATIRSLAEAEDFYSKPLRFISK